MNRRRKILFVGIGNMGWPMAARLVNAGFPLTVADVNAARQRDFVSEFGGRVLQDLMEDVKDVGIILTMLPTSGHVSEVVDSLRPALRHGQILVDMTSGVPSVTQEIAASLAAVGVAMIDAPVSGGVSRAVTGELAIMAGGDPIILDEVSDVFQAMASTIHRTGSIGSGQAVKALNNLVSAGGFLIGIEALIIGQKFGIDATLLTDVLNASTG